MVGDFKPTIGISACLLGEKVRYDGGHKEDRYLTRTLGEFVTWVPVCPEVEMGMPVPRETIQLVQQGDSVHLIGNQTGRDYTEQMVAWAKKRLKQLQTYSLDGYILKKNSPSCGMERVRVYPPNGMPVRRGTGIFADLLLKTFPRLPVEEEGRLNDPVLLENFIERVFAYHRLKKLLDGRPGAGELVAFHTTCKLTLMAHSPVNYRRLGKLVAEAGKSPLPELLRQYADLFMKTLRLKATPKKHANVLYHILGYFKKDLDAGDRAECVQTIEAYRQGSIPLIVPLTLLKHHLRRHPKPYLLEQVYFNPYPAELMLRNKI